MKISKKEKLEKIEYAKELMDEATKLMYAGQLNTAKTMALRAKDIFTEESEPRHIASALNVLAIIYEELGIEQLVLSSFLDALEIALDEEAYDISSKIYNNMASRYMITKTYDRALVYLEKSLEMLEKGLEINMISEKDRTCFVMILYLNLALVNCIEGNEKEARLYFEKGLKLSVHPWNKKARLTFQSFEVFVLYMLGEYEAVEEKIDTVLVTAKNIEYSTNFIESMSYIYEVLNRMGDYERWEKALEIMNNHIYGDVSLDLKEVMLRYWLQFYKEAGRFEEYGKGCIELYELTCEKEVEDNARRATAIEMETEMRLASREKKQTEQIVYSDPLTKIGNRNKMVDDSKRYIDLSVQEGKPVGIGLIDIDYFKECNDTYGHVVGDECLKTVANVLKDAVGERGSVYRFGGDEFLILTYSMSGDEIIELGKTIQENLAKEKIPNEKSSVSEYITVSQGYTRASAEEWDSIETLINQVDKVLYSVKRFGRNNYKFVNYYEIE